MEIRRLDELVPSWDLPKAKEPEYNRMAWKYVDTEIGATYTDMSLVRVPPGNKSYGMHFHETEETYFVIEGKLGVETEDESEVVLEQYECVHFHPGEKHTYRCVGNDELLLLAVHAGTEADQKRDKEMEFEEKYDV